MSTHSFLNRSSILVAALALTMSVQAAVTDLATLPLSTYYAPSSVDVKPNILFVLDDSGSMQWDAMPDQAYWYDTGWSPSPSRFRPNNYLFASNNGMPPYLRYNSAFNGLAYNRDTNYKPPIMYNANGSPNTTSYPSMDRANTAGWTAVKNDGYGVQSTGSSNLSGGVYAYVTQVGEWCDSPDLRVCNTTYAANKYKAPMRWCATAALNTDCRATWDSSRTYPRIPAPRIATIDVSVSASTIVGGITVDGLEIMNAATGSSSSNSTLATQIRDAINACSNAKPSVTSPCQTVGYSATVSGTTVTIYAPGITTSKPVPHTSAGTAITTLGTISTFDRSPIPLPYWRDTGVTPNQSSAAIPGENLRHTITPFVTSYLKAVGRTDCAAPTSCTYDEEMTNYANWHAYYRTRMQMMKTAASRAFDGMDSAADKLANVSRFRVGYMSINNATGSDFLNLNEFKTAHKNAWFTKLFAADPNGGTPLRAALSKAGRLYAGNLTSVNGVTATDPVQYSCQQNFTILSTDGFWNGSAGYKLDGSTAVGNQDGSLPPPYNDGGSTVVQQRTSSLQAQTVTQQAQKGTLQRSTSALQSSTSALQSSTSTLQSSTSTLLKSTLQPYKETSSNSGSTWTAPVAVASCTWDTTTSSRTRCSYGTNWSTPAAGACTPVAKGTNTGNGQTWGTAVACSYSTPTTPANATTCQPVAQSSGTGAWVATARTCSYSTPTTPVPATTCQPVAQSSGTGNWTVQTARTCSYTTPTPVPAATCQPVAQSSGTGNWTVQTARACSYTSPTTPVDVATCVPVAQSSGTGNWTVATATQCSYRFDAAAGTQTCAPAYVANNYTNPTVYSACATSSSGWTNTSSCTATTAWSAAGTKTNCQYTAWSSWGTVSSCTPLAQSTGPNYTVGTAAECQNFASSTGTSDTLADIAAYYYNTDLRKSTATAPDATGTCTGPLKAGSTTVYEDLCTDNVPANGRDVAAWQHMTTYTLGLGAQGKMLFQEDYANDNYWNVSSGDFNSVKTGVTAAPASGVCPWIASGSRCVWPTPASDDPANIDDLWHAAVNGRGSYFSASDPNSLATGLAATLAAIADTPRPGTGAAAASSNPNISAGDNYVFSSFFKSVDWYGDLFRQRLDTTTKDLNPRVDWSASAMLDCATTPWAGGKSYVAGTVYRYGNACYLVTNDYISGVKTSTDPAPPVYAFGTVDTDNSALVSNAPAACSTSWAASTSYAVGSTFSQGGTCYYVIKAYTSGTAFGVNDTANTNNAYVSGAPTSRTIYTKGSSSLANFAWAGTTPGVDSLTTAQKAYFTTPHITYVAGPPATGLSQFCTTGTCLTSADQTSAAGALLVNYLSGDRTNEGTFFRARKHVLGDIVSSEARYVKTPQFSYNDPGYSAYKTAQSSRQAAVYVASNDGMLHAFNAETGQELWAYIPEMVLPELYRLADKNYSQNHRYFVDGTPEVGDVCTSNCTNPATAVWKTILVGGLNGGGQGYYALDITDPASPVLLWEFTHANMGYSYGNPRITKLKTGEWVVLLTSGYNNVADGFGYLFVLNAYDKTLIKTIKTSAGSSATPSGLAKISAYSTNSETDNTTLAVYGGDMLGNLWRFDINGDIGTAGWEAHRLVTFLDDAGRPQPITAKPVETTIEGKPVIYVGTGSYLGVDDISDPIRGVQMQAMYAVKDNLDTSTYSNPRANGSNFVEQTLVAATCTNEPSCTPGEAIRKIPPTTPPTSVDWATQNGWYVDFLTAGERAATDPALALGTLVFTTNTPNNASVDACGIPGVDSSSSWIYFLDYKTGGPVSTAGGVAATTLGNVIATRPVLVRLPDGTVLAMIRTSSANAAGGGGSGPPQGVNPGWYPGAMEGSGTKLKKPPIAPSGGPSRRVSWREITND